MTHRAEPGIFYLPDRGGTDEVSRGKAMRAIAFSSLGPVVTSSLELFGVVISGSVALLSDALHNLGDVFTTVGVSLGFRASRKAATPKYPYGYGRAEDLAGIDIEPDGDGNRDGNRGERWRTSANDSGPKRCALNTGRTSANYGELKITGLKTQCTNVCEGLAPTP